MLMKAKPTNSEMLHVDCVTTRYGDVVALDNVTLRVAAGEVLGVLGPNGAGKTTLLDTIIGLRQPDRGGVRLLDNPVGADGLRSQRHRMGIYQSPASLPATATVAEILRLYAACMAIPDQTAAWLEQLGITEKADSRLARLSNGQRQRLCVGMTLFHDPEFIVMDEPTSELDPQGRVAVWELLRAAVRDDGATILLATHNMEEAHQLCDRVAIIDHGRLLDLDTPAALIERHCPGFDLRFQTRLPLPDSLLAQAVLIRREQHGDICQYRLLPTDLGAFLTALTGWSAQVHVPVEQLQVASRTLEDVFFHLTGKALRD